jgi:hypothetical protein
MKDMASILHKTPE